MSADPILEADWVKAVSAVAQDARKRAKEEAILGRTVNKFGRVVIVNRKKYSHMRKCWDLLLDLDGNQTRFTKLTDDQIKAYKTGNMKQNQKSCEHTPEDITDFETDVKALLKKDHEESQKIRKEFIQHQIDVKNKKDGNITVVTASDPEADSKKKALEEREKELEAREKEIADKEAKAKEDAVVEKEAKEKEIADKEKDLEAREKAIAEAEAEAKAKADATPKTNANTPQGQGSNK